MNAGRKYANGARFERKVRDWLSEELLDAYVQRSPGSKSKVDVFVCRKKSLGCSHVMFIQCKTGDVKLERLKGELVELARVARMAGASAWAAWNYHGGFFLAPVKWNGEVNMQAKRQCPWQ